MKTVRYTFLRTMFTTTLLRVVVAVGVFFAPILSYAIDGPYPGSSWERLSSAEKAGWSTQKLQGARDYAATINTAAVMIIVKGRVLDEWGETARRYNVHSIRKSFLSSLFGIAVAEKKIRLEATLAELEIEDNEPALTVTEKTATVADLLKARSGIYHPALYETAMMAAARPARGSHAPGTFWYYNNWDFNALGTIFERQTGTQIFSAFKARIADPIGMEDYRVSDGTYITGKDSLHPAYPFRMTARDMARFGLLYLRDGVWGGRQLVAKEWITESTTSYSDAGRAGGYGYLWWTSVAGRHLPSMRVPDGAYSARGAGGHHILLVPSWDLVIVHRVDTDVRGRRVTAEEFGELVRLVLAAKITE